MLYIFMIFIISCLINIKFSKKGFKDYIEKEQTTAIKGIFAIIIFFSHFNSYVTLNINGQEKIYYSIISHIGQLMVAIFLFYSGYGILVSSKQKKNYIKDFPKKRILKTIINFDIAVVLFLIVDNILGIQYSVKDIIFSFIGWTSIGNSNWFIFSILVMYFITYICARINKKIDKKAVVEITILSCLVIIAMYFVKDRYWYDTILCYSAGLWFALYKEKIDSIIEKNNNIYVFSIITLFLFFLAFYFLRNKLLCYEVLAVLFCLIIVIINYKIKINNKLLQFFGKYSFEIYILQRLSFIVFKKVIENKYEFFFFSFLLTIFISFIFKKIINMLYVFIDNKKNKAILLFRKIK